MYRQPPMRAISRPRAIPGPFIGYRKDFELPRAESKHAWIMRFESVNYRANVWLNGRRLGKNVGA
jgi:beta-galactosidase/beta-glucuronidase